MNNWRITSDITLVVENIDGTNIIYIASPEKKQYEVSVSKLAERIYKTITIENNDLEIKIGECGNMYLKTSQIPELDWVMVKNFYTPSIWNILNQCKSDCGKISGKFNAIFSDSDIKVVSFVSKDMIEFTDATEEMKRRLRCEFGKKTKLLKPGHRYDLVRETRYYICPVVYRKSSPCNSGLLSDIDTLENKAYIYTNLIKPTDTTTSDILRNNKFGTNPYDLKIAILDGTTWIDSGEKLKDDFSGDIKDYWEPIVDNSIKAYKQRVGNSEYYTNSYNIKEILEILSCQSSENLDYKLNSSLNKKIYSIVREKLEYNLLSFWKIRNSDVSLEINDTKKLEDNVNALVNRFYKTLYDENIEKFTYYGSLFSLIEIDLKTIATDLILSFSESELSKTFENYTKYMFFWENKKFLYSKTILDFELNELKDTPDDINYIFTGSELSNVISEMYNYANLNYGSGVSEYRLGISGKKSKEPIVSCLITLKDIIKFKKGVSGLSENLKNEIKDNKFSTILICCKKSDTL